MRFLSALRSEACINPLNITALDTNYANCAFISPVYTIKYNHKISLFLWTDFEFCSFHGCFPLSVYIVTPDIKCFYSRTIAMPPSSWTSLASWMSVHAPHANVQSRSLQQPPGIPRFSRTVPLKSTNLRIFQIGTKKKQSHRHLGLPTAAAVLLKTRHGQKNVLMQRPQLSKQPNRPFFHSPDGDCSAGATSVIMETTTKNIQYYKCSTGVTQMIECAAKWEHH